MERKKETKLTLIKDVCLKLINVMIIGKMMGKVLCVQRVDRSNLQLTAVGMWNQLVVDTCVHTFSMHPTKETVKPKPRRLSKCPGQRTRSRGTSPPHCSAQSSLNPANLPAL